MTLFSVCSNPFSVLYYSDLSLCWESDDILRMSTLIIFELAVLTAVQLSLYASDGAAPVYYIRSLLLDHFGGGMLF